VTKPWFDGFIMFVILLSSVALAAEDPVQENHPRNKLLKIFDYGFTAIFAVECLLKVRPIFHFIAPNGNVVPICITLIWYGFPPTSYTY